MLSPKRTKFRKMMRGNNRGLAWQAKGDNDRAVEDFTAAIRLAPSDGVNYLARCHSYAVAGDVARAVADCDKSLELNPNRVWAKQQLEKTPAK